MRIYVQMYSYLHIYLYTVSQKSGPTITVLKFLADGMLRFFSALTLLVGRQQGHLACKNGVMVEVSTG